MSASTQSEPIIRAFFDEPTNTVSYIVADPETRQPPSSIPCSTTTTTAAALIPARSRRC